jgi:FAD/FMN-containing dehydrogenase
MTTTIEIKGLDSGAVALTAEQVTAFRGTFRGPVLLPTDAGYDAARAVWNGMIDRRPAMIARCTGTADVQAAVRFARQHRLLSSVRGGGHNIAGLAVADGGLMIDTSPMRGMYVDPVARVARAQAGCTLADVDRETQVHGLAAVLGFVSATGVGGLTTGGGFGYLSRRHGWTCDNLGALEVVTADGNIVRASASENPDLFWGLRGGSGNFGIVTSFEYQLHPCGPTIVGGPVVWPGEDAPAVLRFYRELTASAPRELTTVAVLRLAPPAPWLPPAYHGKPIIMLLACHSGDPAEGEKVVAPIKAFGKPVGDLLVRRPYAQLQTLLDAANPSGRRYYWKSEYMASIEPGAIDAMVARAASIPSPHSGLIFFQIGGALNELPAEHSPVGNRDARFVCNIASSWEQADADAVNVTWTRDTWQAIRPFSTGGTYVNFLTEEDGEERVRAAYGGNLGRLAALKREWDPRNVFRSTKQVLAEPPSA